MKKLFIKNDYFNPKNDVIWVDDRSVANELSGLHSVEKYPVYVMVAVGATWYELTSSYFFLKGERLNGQSYHDQLLPFYKVEGERLFGPKNWGFQQDGLAPILLIKFKMVQKKTSNSSFQKKCWPRIHPN